MEIDDYWKSASNYKVRRSNTMAKSHDSFRYQAMKLKGIQASPPSHLSGMTDKPPSETKHVPKY